MGFSNSKKPATSTASSLVHRGNKSYELLFLQFLAAIGIAWVGYRRVLTTGAAHQLFFESAANANVDLHTMPIVVSAAMKPFVLTENYFTLALEGKFGEEARQLEPMRVMQEYVAQHSNDVLEREWAACNGSLKSEKDCFSNRSFLVSAYACPHYAGRRLHTFMNGLIWSIVTNRTFLWYYMDSNQCHVQEEAWGASDCNRNNTQQDCNEYLLVSDWMPSLEHWQSRIGLVNHSQIVRANFAKRDPLARPHDQPDAPRFLTHGQQPHLLPGVDLTRPLQRQKLLMQKPNIQRSSRLFWYGHYFTYGMLQEVLFTLKGDEYEKQPLSENHKTYAFHSRHSRPSLRRQYDSLERTCVEQLGPVGRNASSDVNCTIYMMLDNHGRYDYLKQHIDNAGCTAKRIEHEVVNDHAYFRDWVFVRHHARSGFFAPHRRRRPGIGMRPSSALLRESLEFRRRLELAQNSNAGEDWIQHHECFDGYDWDAGPMNCTRVDLIAASFGMERYQERYGTIRDPCLWAWRNQPNKSWSNIIEMTDVEFRRPGRAGQRPGRTIGV